MQIPMRKGLHKGVIELGVDLVALKSVILVVMIK